MRFEKSSIFVVAALVGMSFGLAVTAAAQTITFDGCVSASHSQFFSEGESFSYSVTLTSPLSDLREAHALAAQFADAAFEVGRRAFGLASGHKGTVLEPGRMAVGGGVANPPVDGFFTHTAGRCCGPPCEPFY